MAKKAKIVCMLLVACLLFAACWDKVELESRGFAISIGVDKEGNNFVASMVLPDVNAFSEGKNEDVKKVKETKSETLAGALAIVDGETNKKVYYGHTKLILLGHELLTDKDMLQKTIDALERNSEISRKTLLMATNKTAGEILSSKPEGEPLVGVYVSNFYQNNASSVAVTDKMDLEKLIGSFLISNGGAVIPRIGLEGEGEEAEIKIGGAIVLKDFEQVGEMAEEDMLGYLWFSQNAVGTKVTIEEENIVTPFFVTTSKETFSFDEKDGHIVCQMKVNVEGTVNEYQFMKDGLFDAEKIKTLQQKCETEIANEIQKTFEQFQTKWRMDGFGFLEKIRKWNYPLYLTHENNWEESFQNMVLEPDVQVSITNTGSVQ